MATDDARGAPPRRPGDPTGQNLRITMNVRWGLALLGLGVALVALLALGGLSEKAATVVRRVTVVTVLLACGALIHAARSAWLRRQR